jgi:hypothetical protein
MPRALADLKPVPPNSLDDSAAAAKARYKTPGLMEN